MGVFPFEMTLRLRSEELEEGSGTSRFPEGAEGKEKEEDSATESRKGKGKGREETNCVQQPERREGEGYQRTKQDEEKDCLPTN